MPAGSRMASRRPSGLQLRAIGRISVFRRTTVHAAVGAEIRTPPGKGEGELVARSARPPGGRDGDRLRREPVSTAAVPADDVERTAREIGHAAAGRHAALDRPARQRDRPRRAERASAAWPSATWTATSPAAGGEHGVRAVRREIAVARRAERADAAARIEGVGDAAPEREHDSRVHLHRRAAARDPGVASCRADGRRRRLRPRPAARPGRARPGAECCSRRRGAGARSRKAASTRRRPRSPASISPGASKPRKRAVSSRSFVFTPRPPRRARRVRGAGAS